MQIKTAGFMATATLALGMSFATAANAHDHRHHNHNRRWDHHHRIAPQRIIPQYGYGYAYPQIRQPYLPQVTPPYYAAPYQYGSGRGALYETVPCYPVLDAHNMVITVCPR